MMHFVATDDLQACKDECPNLLPTHRLTCGIVLGVAANLGLQLEEISVLLSMEAVKAISSDEIFPEMRHMFYIPMLRKNRRYNWVTTDGVGKWVEVDTESIEHDYAPFEDAVISSMIQKKEFGVVRFRRVVEMEELEFCEQ